MYIYVYVFLGTNIHNIYNIQYNIEGFCQNNKFLFKIKVWLITML